MTYAHILCLPNHLNTFMGYLHSYTSLCDSYFNLLFILPRISSSFLFCSLLSLSYSSAFTFACLRARIELMNNPPEPIHKKNFNAELSVLNAHMTVTNDNGIPTKAIDIRFFATIVFILLAHRLRVLYIHLYIYIKTPIGYNYSVLFLLGEVLHGKQEVD